jgi:hypothetical protein
MWIVLAAIVASDTVTFDPKIAWPMVVRRSTMAWV